MISQKGKRKILWGKKHILEETSRLFNFNEINIERIFFNFLPADENIK